MRNLTVRTRVTLIAVSVLALGLLVVSVGINLLLSHQLDADASATLRNRVAAQLAATEVTAKGIQVEEHPNDQALDHHSFVITAGGRVLDRANAEPEVALAAHALAGLDRPTEREVGTVRLRAAPVRDKHGAIVGTVVVGLSLVPYNHSKEIALIGTAALSLVLLLLGAFAVRRAVGAALEPVGEMTRRAAEWGAQDLHRRFDTGGRQDELTRLAATFNGLLGRIEGVLRHEQRFSAEMAHELRTPLTGLRTEAELALKSGSGDPELRGALERVVSGTERMTAVIETLLASARASSATPAGACEAAAPMAAAADGVRPAAQARGVEVALRAPAGRPSVEAPADVVAHALAPLLENAVRHAATRIVVGAETRNGQVALVVSDDGPGLSGDDLETLFAPGASTTGGAGLGLPLARRLARSCGGDVVAVPSDTGARFELRLPSSP